MPETKLVNVKRCTAKHGGKECGSAVFYDWGLSVMGSFSMKGISGAPLARFEGTADPNHIKICARCTTPYIIEDGDLVDISEELSGEDVKAIIVRGQIAQPHPSIKDP